MRNLQSGAHAVLITAPDGVFVLDGEDALEPALVKRVHDRAPIDFGEPRDAVAPPADVPRILTADGLTGVPVAVATIGECLDVLGLGMGHAVDVRSQRLDGVDTIHTRCDGS